MLHASKCRYPVHFKWLHHPIWWLLHTIAASVAWGQSTCSAAAVALMDRQVQPVIFFGGHGTAMQNLYCTKTSVSTAAIPLTFWYFFWVWYRYCLMSNTVRLCFGSVEVVQTSVSSEIAIFGCIAHTHTELREQCYRLALSQRAPYWCVGTASLLQGFRCLLLFQPWFSHRGHFSWSFWSGLGIQSIGLATTPVTARSWDMVGPLDEAVICR